MLTIGKRFMFDAAHRLGKHEGKCRRPHGHTYILELDLTGSVAQAGSGQGMVVDYYIIKDIVQKNILDLCDHQDLNVVLQPYFPGVDPETENMTTAENMVNLFGGILELAFMAAGYPGILTRVRLQETQNSWAEWNRPPAARVVLAREYGVKGPTA